MFLSEIRDYIRVEGEIKGIGEYSVLIDYLINTELRQYTGKAKFNEMQVPSPVVFTISDPTVNSFTLPSDFQLFDFVVWARPDDTNITPLNLTPGRGISFGHGIPEYYRSQGANFFVYPFSDLCLNDTITLGYYKTVILQNETDEFPVPSLEKAVIQKVISRLPTISTAKQQSCLAEAKQAFLDARAEYAGNQ